jgi:FixJ family two-component response regulator
LSQPVLISIVDDDGPFRESMRRLMKSLGYPAEAFASGADFLASALVNRTSCLIADVHMPLMTGFELQRNLVAAGHRIPTILVTAYPSAADRARALRAGIVCYLRKPVHEQDLSQCLEVALSSPKAP